MSTFTVRFDTDNAAFDECGGMEVASVLRDVADRVQSRDREPIHPTPILDVNGNRVGSFQWDMKEGNQP